MIRLDMTRALGRVYTTRVHLRHTLYDYITSHHTELSHFWSGTNYPDVSPASYMVGREVVCNA